MATMEELEEMLNQEIKSSRNSKHAASFEKIQGQVQALVNKGYPVRAICRVMKKAKLFTGSQTTFAKLVRQNCTLKKPS